MIFQIQKTAELSELERKGIAEIFWQTAVRENFASEEEKEKYFQDWAGVYLEYFEKEVFLAMSDEKVLGYLLGCLDTRKFVDLGFADERIYNLFSKETKVYPAHFHINCRDGFRGLGIGGKLLNAYIDFLHTKSIPGVHIITSPNAKNRCFYKKNGFDFEMTKDLYEKELLFLARRL